MKRVLIAVAILMCFSKTHSLIAQNLTVTITGPTNVSLNTVVNYSAEFYNQGNQYVNPPIGGTMIWTAIGGTVTYQNELYCEVRWEAGGTGTIMFEYENLPLYYYADRSVQMPVPVLPDPTGYLTTLYEVCGSTTVTRNTGPSPSDVYEWWWQTSSTGTSTSLGNSASVTLYSSTALFLRSRLKASPYTWGTGSSAITPIVVYQAAPAMPSTANNSAQFFGSPVTLSVAPVAGATRYQWYNSDLQELAGRTFNNSTFNSLPLGSNTFYVSAWSGPCESGRLAVLGTVVSFPSIQVVSSNTGLAPNQPVVLGLNQTYSSYLWRNSMDEAIGTQETQEINLSGVYTVTVTQGGIDGSALSSPKVVAYGAILNDENFISSTVVNVPGVTDYQVSLGGLDYKKANQEFTYLDGLGKPIQSVLKMNSPLVSDIVKPNYYNQFGQELREYLPFVSGDNTGNIKSINLNQANNELVNFYKFSQNTIAQDSIPYREKMLEASPLARLKKQGEMGSVWQPNGNANNLSDKSTKYDYLFNSEQEVILFHFDKSARSITSAEFYSPNKLSLGVTYDANNFQIKEFKDLNGLLVCKMVQTNSDGQIKFASTYYLYDDFDNLVVVLPPEAVKSLRANFALGE